MKKALITTFALVLVFLAVSCGSGTKMKTTIITSIIPEYLDEDGRKEFMNAIPPYFGYEEDGGYSHVIKSLEDGRMAYYNSGSLFLLDAATGKRAVFSFGGYHYFAAVDITPDGRYALCAESSYSDGININIFELESSELGVNGNLKLIGNWNNSMSSFRRDVSLLDAKIADDGSRAYFAIRRDSTYVEQDSICLITDRDWDDDTTIYFTQSKDEKIRSIYAIGESKVIANTDFDRERYSIIEIAEGRNSRWQSSILFESEYQLTGSVHNEKIWVSEARGNEIRISSYGTGTWTGRSINDFRLTLEDAARIDGLTFSPSGERMAIYYRPGIEDKELRATKVNVYDIKSGEANLVSSFVFPFDDFYDPVFIDENTLKSDTYDAYLAKLDGELYTLDLIELPEKSDQAVAVSKDGRFAFAQSDRKAKILKREAGNAGFSVLKEMELDSPYYKATFAPDSSFIAIYSSDLLIIDLESGRETSISFEDSPYSIAISNANEIVAGFDGKFVVYEYTGTEINEKSTVENETKIFGRRVACGGNNIFVSSKERIHIYDESLNEIANLKIQPSEKFDSRSTITDIKASSDGSRIIVAEGLVAYKTIRVIDKADDGYHETYIRSVDASKNNNTNSLIVSAANDGHTLLQTFRKNDCIYVLSDRSGSWEIAAEIESLMNTLSFGNEEFAVNHDVSADGKTAIISCEAPFAAIVYPVASSL